MAVDLSKVNQNSSMGATILEGGTGFRTWAPNANMVSVIAGTPALTAASAAGWTPAATDNLAKLPDGTWQGFLAGIGDGDPYMFWIDGTGSSGWKRDTWARELTLDPAFTSCYCVVRDPVLYPWHDQGWRTPQFSDLIIYQLHVGVFWAQDAAGNDVRTTQTGTFLDAIEKLDYLRDLGVNAVQFLPLQQFVTPFSDGYNECDYFTPETQYIVAPAALPARLTSINAKLAVFGQPALTLAQLTPGINQLKCLIDLCHLHGMAVIFDEVYNHAGGNFDLQSIWFYDRQANGNLNNSLYFTDQGFADGQIFAFWNNWISQFLIDNACFFLREYHIDGIRYDEVRIIENSGARTLCQSLTNTVRFTNPSAIQIAEYWNPNRPSAVEPPPGGLGFDAELGDGLRDALRGLLGQAVAGESAPIDLSSVASTITGPSGFPDPWRVIQCVENEDITYVQNPGSARVAALADPGNHRSWYAASRSRLVTSLVLAAPGISALFMGEEFLEDKIWSDDRSYNGLIYWAGLTTPDSAMRDFLQFTKDLLKLRNSQAAFRGPSARVSRAENFDRVIVLHRWLEGFGGDVVVVASVDELPKFGYTVGLPYGGTWRELFNSDYYYQLPNPAVIGNGGSVQASGGPLDGFTSSATMTIPGNGVIVLGR